jgi:hypothetical protein
MTAPIQNDPPGPTPFAQLLERAQDGDRSVLPALRQLLDREAALWQHCGDLARHAEETWLRLITGKNLLLQEAIPRKLAELKAELTSPDATVLERLLVQRIGLCWLQVYFADLEEARGRTGGQAHPATGEQLRKRLDGAHKRYLQALKQLAAVRKLLRRSPSPLEVAAHLPFRNTTARGPASESRAGAAQSLN